MPATISDSGITTASLPPHLQSDRQIHVIVSTLSGSHGAVSYYQDTLKPLLDRHGAQYSTHLTESTQTIIELTRSKFLPNAVQGQPQTVLLLSGDGGLIDVVDTLASHLQQGVSDAHAASTFVKPVICLVPQGTANALAWSAGIAPDTLNTLLTGRPKNLPIFGVTFSPGARLVADEGASRETIPTLGTNEPRMFGAVVFSWGIHASLVARSDTAEYRKHGIDRFKMAAHELLVENHAYSGDVSVRSASSNEWQPLVIPQATDRSVNSSSTNSVVDENEDGDSDSDISSSPRTSQTTVESDGRLHDQRPKPASVKLSYLAATLVSNLEEKYVISPHTKPLSGSMYLISMSHLPAADIASLTHLPYENGQHITDPRVSYKEIDAMRIDFREEGRGDKGGDGGQWRQVCIDGKIVEIEKGGWVILERVGAKNDDRDEQRWDGSVVDVVVPASV